MANVKISELAAVSTIAGTEPIPLVQSGANSSVTPSLLATYVRGTITGGTGTVTSVSIATGTTGLTTSGGPITTSGTITIGGTLAVANGGTGVTTSTGSTAVVLSNSPTLVTPNLGTPSAAVLTNATGLPVTTGITGMAAAMTTFLATPSGANFAAVMTDETGTGSVVFNTNPILITPNIGTPSAGVMTNVTGLPLTTGVTGVLTVGKGGTNTTTASTGSGGIVLANSPSLVTPNLGTPSAAVLTNATGLPATTGITGILTTGNGGTNTSSASTGTGGVVLSNSPTLTGTLATSTINATGQLHATVADSGIGLLINGGSKGFRVVPNATETRLEGVDNTGVGSFQPLILSGTVVGVATSLMYGGVTLSSAVAGTGSMVLSNSPALVTPTLGVASATSMTADAFLVTTNWAVATGTIAKTLVSADNGKHFKFTTSASITLSVNTGLPAGFWCAASQGSSGQITIAGTATTTSVNGKKSSGLGAKMMVENWATTDTYLISGSITT